MRAVTRWCFRHRLLVVAAWLLALVAFNFAVRGVGSDYADNFNLPQTQSSQAMSLLERSAPRSAGDVDQLVIAIQGHTTLAAAHGRAE
ncbi:MAG TPA: hypothetical protein VME01_03805, partial [Solirubrobacteraceae bacterium]|nr:hypothetical protein [Solirubrobacteraceae bacterium]